MRHLNEIDRWLITRIFEPITWWVEHRTGANQFALARYALTILLAGDLMVHYMIPQRNGLPVSFVGLGAASIALAAAVMHSRYSELHARRDNNNDRETVGGRWLRGALAIFTAYMLIAGLASDRWPDDAMHRSQTIFFTIGNTAYLSFLYFCACRMKPPT